MCVMRSEVVAYRLPFCQAWRSELMKVVSSSALLESRRCRGEPGSVLLILRWILARIR
jgi:hypothetical protein